MGALFDQLTDAVLVLDRAGRIRYGNESARVCFGLSREDISGKTGVEYWQALPEARGTSLEEAFGAARREQRSHTCEYPCAQENRWFDVRVVPLGPDALATVFHETTERRALAYRLTTREQQLLAALRGARMMAWEWDLETGACTRFGAVKEVIGFDDSETGSHASDYFDRIHPDDRPRLQQIAQNAIHGGAAYEVECRFYRRPDEMIWIRDVGHVIRDADGRARRMAGVCTDITSRRHVETRAECLNHELQRVVSLLEAHFNNSPLAVVEWDQASVVSRWSQGAERLFGWTADEVVGRTLSEFPLVHPADEAHVATVAARLCSGREPFVPSRNRNLTKSGNVLVCDWYNTVVTYPGGLSTLSLVLDVTERQRADLEKEGFLDQLRQSEQRFRLLADAMPQLVWTADAQGMVDYYNAQIQHYSGAEVTKEGTWSWQPMIHPDDALATARTWSEAARTGYLYSCTHRVRMANGTYRWHLSRGTPVRNAAGEIIKWFGTATDVDDQVRASERLEQTVAERTAALRETVAELEAFSYSVSHDMRAPLRAMRGYAEILIEEFAHQISDEGRHYLTRIGESARRMDALVHDVLTYSRTAKERIVLGPIALDELVRAIVSQYPEFQSPRTQVEIESPLGVVRAHEGCLAQCVSNLLGNAVKFVPAGVVPRIRIRTERAGPRIRLWFEDNGIGIAPDHHERIFEIFGRVHSDQEYEGTGIGLAIVRQAVDRMHGRVGVVSELGRGSAFWLELDAID